MCLEELEQENLSGRSFLDVGTGSGILAMAAAAMGAGRTVALDVDPEAVRVARDNIALQPDASGVKLLCGGPEAIRGLPFDLITANLNGAILRELLGDLGSLMAEAGTLILSGILEEETEPLEQDARRHALRPLRSRSREGWICTVLGRADA
jgi:ribosomal protein L11 methyltransferase